MATHSSVLAWRIPGTGSLVGCCLWGRTESDTTKATQQQQLAFYRPGILSSNLMNAARQSLWSSQKWGKGTSDVTWDHFRGS